jgi:hypothetical protein
VVHWQVPDRTSKVPWLPRKLPTPVHSLLADRFGGKKVLAAGVAWFSLASLLLPMAMTPAVVAASLTVPVLLASRFAVVRAPAAASVLALDCLYAFTLPTHVPHVPHVPHVHVVLRVVRTGGLE